jgi:hypothetical protein
VAAEVFFNNASELATLTNTFEVSDVATDPTTVTLVITDPTGTATTYTYAATEITKDTTGVYHKDIPCTAAGTWQYVWIGTGTATDVVAGTWTVVSTALQNLYCTPEMLKNRKGITDNHDDVEILGACRAVARWIDKQYCERFFYRLTATLTLSAADWYCLKVPDLVTVTTLKTDSDGDGVYETTWTANVDYQLLPVNAAAGLEQEPYDEIKAIGAKQFPVVCGTRGARTDRVQIVGVWGWPAVPEPVIEAAKILAGDYLKLGGMAFGVAGYGEYGAVRARMSNPAMEMLNAYRKNPVLIG